MVRLWFYGPSTYGGQRPPTQIPPSEAVMRWAVPTLRDYFFAAKSSPMRTVWQIWRIVSL